MKLKINNNLFSRALLSLVGGVNSPVRSFNYVGGEPALIRQGKDAQVCDYDGNSYIDFVLSYGALMLGHANPVVVRKVSKSLENGFNFGMTSKVEIELAEIIKKAVPFIDKLRFVNSGTESLMSAVRLARGFTGKKKIIKFVNSYHGHADLFLAKAGSGLATLNIATSDGVPDEFIKDTVVCDYGDRASVEKAFRSYGHNVAAIVVEPIGANYGVGKLDKGFLRYLRKSANENGSLLIFDEVVTGFRFRFGSISDIVGVKPDIICLGKIIGGGLPVGAYGAKKKIMDCLAPLGPVYQASTFGGNPIVMTSGIATLTILAKKNYKHLNEIAQRFVAQIKELTCDLNLGLKISNYGSMFSFKFDEKRKFEIFYKLMLEAGVLFVPSEYEVNFLSFAHTKSDLSKTLSLIKVALKVIK